MSITKEEIERRLGVLREKYRHALHQDREIIVRQARALQIAREKLEKHGK